MLWGQAVVHRKHGTATGVAELTAQDIMGFDIADHPAAAMVINQSGGKTAAAETPRGGIHG
jgi:hypothetical protein